MKNAIAFAFAHRASTLLACSAAVLLSACGGTDLGNAAQTAASIKTADVAQATAAAGQVASQVAALTAESAGTGNFEQAAAAGSTAVSQADSAVAADAGSATASATDAPAPATRLLASVSTASAGNAEQVINLYRSLLGREPDSAGLQYWVQQVNAGMSIDAVSAAIRASAEYTNRQTAAPAAADTSIYHLYVATNGADSNAGTQAKPFKTLTKAAAAAKAGTTVHVAAGTYSGNVTTKVSGTSSNRIRFVSDAKWGAKIVGTGAEAAWTNSGNYIEINGFDISGSGRLGIVNNGSNTLVSNNHIHDIKVSGGCSGGGGAGVVNANYSGSNGDIIGNVVHDIGTPGGCNGVQGIYSSNKGGKIMNNVVYRASSYGIHLWHAATDVTIANNTVFANGSSGMGGGIVIGTGDSPGGVQMKNTRIINNIVVNNPRSGIMQYCYSGESCIGSGNVTANNLVYGNGSAISLKTGSATGTISADPKFVSYNPAGTGDYRLQSSSPAVNTGSATSAPANDILGTARPLGGAVDIGAYENY